MSLKRPIYAAAWPRSPRIGIAPKWRLTMNCRCGDVVLVLFPDSNLRTAKRRPALVVQADRLDANLPQTIVATITSSTARAGHASRVSVLPGGESAKRSGLLMESVIMTDNPATARYSEIDRVIGSLRDLTETDAALRTTLAL
jgi:mRNA interferase MazF